MAYLLALTFCLKIQLKMVGSTFNIKSRYKSTNTNLHGQRLLYFNFIRQICLTVLSDCFEPEADFSDMDLGRLGRFSLAECSYSYFTCML